jgi:hypothetical protein
MMLFLKESDDKNEESKGNVDKKQPREKSRTRLST